jgi:hypothetical protein
MAPHLVELLEGVRGAERTDVEQRDELRLIEPHRLAEMHLRAPRPC